MPPLPQPTNTKHADLSSQIDGVRTVFTLPEEYLPGSVTLHLSGVEQQKDPTIWVEGPGPTEVTVVDPPDGVQDTTLTVSYEIAASFFPIVNASGFFPV